MILKKIELINYRNFKKNIVIFDKNINIFTGDNAQGKTNLLESIYVLAITKSYKTNNDINLLKKGEKKFIIRGTLKKNKFISEISVEYMNGNKKTYINKSEIKRISEYVSNMNVILVSPENIEALRSTPTERRNLLNIELSQISSNYLKKYNEFNKILKMRNDYLKKMYVNKLSDTRYLDVLTDNLIEREIEIYYERYNFIKEINDNISKIYKEISETGFLEIKYETGFDFTTFTREEIKKVLKETYFNNYNLEINSGITLHGPHRDDLIFLLNGENLKFFGSQGQQKLAIISFKLAEISIFKEKSSYYPIVLLDDIFSELDKKKKNKLIKYLKNNVQIIITVNDVRDIDKKTLGESKIFIVKEGKIIEKGEKNGK